MLRIVALLVALLSLASLMPVAAQAQPRGDQDIRLIAGLRGQAPLKGTATYRERVKKGQVQRIFKVQLENAVPGTTYDVVVDGGTVGQITINGLGRGKLVLKNITDDFPGPTDVPEVQVDDVVQVGPLTGRFWRKD